MGFKSHIFLKKNHVSSGFTRVNLVMGRPAGSPKFGRAVASAGLLLNPDRFSHRVDSPGQAGCNNTGLHASHHMKESMTAYLVRPRISYLATKKHYTRLNDTSIIDLLGKKNKDLIKR